MAVNCCVLPKAIDGLAGVTVIETSAGGVTVSVVEPLTPPEVAVMVVLPVATVLAKPAAVMVATLVADELHVTELLMLEEVPLL